MSLKRFGKIILAIMVLIIFHGIVVLIVVRASGYSHADVFWFGPIGSFLFALYSALFIGFIVCLVILGIIGLLAYLQTKKRKLENKVVSVSLA